MLLDLEVAEERSVEHLQISVLAPGGWVRVTHVCLTTPMRVWTVVAGDYRLTCAGKHLIITPSGPTPADQLEIGMLICTQIGVVPVSDVYQSPDDQQMYDLRVDSEDHVYYTNGIASHNSTGLGAAELFKLNVLPNYRSLYITPMHEQLKTLAEKFMDMQRGSVFPAEYSTSRGIKNSMYYKGSVKGGFLRLMYVLTDAGKCRGLSANSLVLDEAQHFDAEHLGELGQVQKAFEDTRTTVFAGTSLDMDTCLERQYQLGSRGVWHIHCDCKDGWHSLDNKDTIPKMMSVDGLRCPHTARLLNPMLGEFVHESTEMLELKQVSFHLPQLIVPEYASGEKFLSIWKDFKRMSEKQFLQEVMGIPVEAGVSELNEADLKACCSDKTFPQIQQDYLSGRVRYAYLFSGCDWGGSDWNPATKTKQSYTVHTIYGLTADGVMELVYACRYAGMNYQDIAGTIVEAHNKFKTFAIGTDNGGGSYYNAYMRDCGRIPTNKIISFNYTDTKLLLERIPHPEAHIMSLHRSDSISALISDIKAKKIRFPRWDESGGFVLDCLNMRRNITESQSGRAVMRYVRHGSKADDFMQSTNYACMMKRIITQESLIPNRQILDELGGLFGTRQVVTTADHYRSAGGLVSG